MMVEGTALYAKQINHGQSEIWLGADGKELTQRRTLATNEVVNVARRHCAPEVFATFYGDYHRAIGHIAALVVPNLGDVAAELRLRA
jgi:hypothetical protein